MRVLYIGMYSQDGQKGLESSSLEKRKQAAAAIAKAAWWRASKFDVSPS